MSRRRVAVKRETTPDPKYDSVLVTRFVNKIMLDGKKTIAQRIFYTAIEDAARKLGGKDPMEVLDRVIENVRPLLEVKSRRIGGATYQIPVEVNYPRSLALAVRWLVDFARARKGMPMAKALSAEFVDAAGNQGTAVKKREDTHKMAEANKAFAHYRW
jgi:small subunit ribosomal protein S7